MKLKKSSHSEFVPWNLSCLPVGLKWKKTRTYECDEVEVKRDLLRSRLWTYCRVANVELVHSCTLCVLQIISRQSSKHQTSIRCGCVQNWREWKSGLHALFHFDTMDCIGDTSILFVYFLRTGNHWRYCEAPVRRMTGLWLELSVVVTFITSSGNLPIDAAENFWI